MINITLNGKPFSPQTFEEMLIQAVAEELRDKLGSIRHPETGEFPTIAISGSSLDKLSVQAEGSPELLELVKARLAEFQESNEDDSVVESEMENGVPKVFLSFAFEDIELAGKIANTLQASGIDTWWSEWCIGAGDSIRQKIDEGLGDCTHFVVLLTPYSISKPWVNQEMDAGLVRKLSSGSKFIALRSELAASELPPLLQGALSPSVNPINLDLTQLINDIHGVTRKPPLGQPPAAVSQAKAISTGYSAAATALAKFFVETTKVARKLDPCITLHELASKLSLSEEDVEDAVFELKGLVTKHRPDLIYPEEELFVRFDKFWMGWNPEEDALRVASGLVNHEKFPCQPSEIDAIVGWGPRRLNAAIAYMVGRGLIKDVRAMNGGPWLAVHLMKTDATRRFVKSK